MKKIIKRIFFVYAVVALNYSALAQNPSWQWAKAARGVEDEYGSSIAVDSQGNVYMLGDFNSPVFNCGTSQLFNYDGSDFWTDIFLAKYDSSGNLLWVSQAGGNAHDNGYAITINDNDEIIITGTFISDSISFDNITLYNHPWVNDNHDMFIAKYNTDGQVMWAKGYGGGGKDAGYGVACDHDGNIFLAGLAGSTTIIFDADTLNIAGGNNAFIAKFNSSGTAQWVKSPYGNCFETAYGLTLDSDNNAYVTGLFSGDSITFDNISVYNSGLFGTDDAFVVKYNSTGQAVWVKKITSGSQPEIGKSIAVDNDGNVIVSGTVGGSLLQFDNLSLNVAYAVAGNTNMFIAKYTPDGNILWAKAGGNLGADAGNSVKTDSGNNVYVSGEFQTSLVLDNDSLWNEWHSELFVTKISPAGNIQWMKGVDSLGWNRITGMALYAGDIYVTGMYGLPMVAFDTVILGGNGGQDAFVARLHQPAQTTAVNEISNDVTVSLMPNPVKNTLQLQLDNSKDYIERIEVTDVAGKKAVEKTVHTDHFQTDVSYLQCGLYFVKIVTQKGISFLKFIKD